MIEAWFAGGFEPRHGGGYASYATVVTVDGVLALQEAQYIGGGKNMSCNVAEYAGVCAALEFIRTLEGRALVRGDSALVINQLRSRWGARGGLYTPYYERAVALKNAIPGRVRFQLIPREENGECEALARDVIWQRGIRIANWRRHFRPFGKVREEGGESRVRAGH